MSLKVEKRYGGQQGWVLKTTAGKFVPRAAWPYGLKPFPEWTLEQARAYVKSLNAKSRIVAEEVSRIAGARRLRRKARVESAFLPQSAVAEFEALFMQEPDPTGKHWAAWRRAQEVVRDLAIDPCHYWKVPQKLYAAFEKRRWSADWSNRVLRRVNDYGYLYADSLGRGYKNVPAPAGEWETRIATAFHSRLPRGRKSKPLTPELLSRLKGQLSEANFAWVSLSFWFGLRPEEVDQLARGERFEIEEGPVLRIYQPKLRAVAPELRWKRIPAWLPEQRAALELVAGELTRPSRRTVRRFPEGVTLYGGRHGFTHLMQRLGQEIAAISSWLGHRELSTTQRYYQDLGILKNAA